MSIPSVTSFQRGAEAGGEAPRARSQEGDTFGDFVSARGSGTALRRPRRLVIQVNGGTLCRICSTFFLRHEAPAPKRKNAS